MYRIVGGCSGLLDTAWASGEILDHTLGCNLDCGDIGQSPAYTFTKLGMGPACHRLNASEFVRGDECGGVAVRTGVPWKKQEDAISELAFQFATTRFSLPDSDSANRSHFRCCRWAIRLSRYVYPRQWINTHIAAMVYAKGWPIHANSHGYFSVSLDLPSTDALLGTLASEFASAMAYSRMEQLYSRRCMDEFQQEITARCRFKIWNEGQRGYRPRDG